MNLLQSGNTKLGKHQVMFNIPATTEICGQICKGCYAEREQRRFPSVLQVRTERYLASLSPSFVTQISAELTAMKKPPKFVRIHASGEFYSQQYLDKWTQIAITFPTITFYAFTKMLSKLDFTTIMSLPNVVIINSLPNGKINYGKTPPAGMFVCPATSSAIQCGIDCTWCQTKNCADLHGVWFTQH